jgi:autotransporter-associated beta strand protein
MTSRAVVTAAFAAVQCIVLPVLATTNNWLSLTDGNWSAGTNWSTGSAPILGDNLSIDGTQSYASTEFLSLSGSATTSLSAASAYFDAGSVSIFSAVDQGSSSVPANVRQLSLGSNTSVGSAILTLGTSATTGTFYFGGSNNNSGSLTLNLAFSNQRSVTIASGKSIWFTSFITGTGGMIIDGAGTVQFGLNLNTGVGDKNTFTGGMTLSSGTVQVSSDGTTLSGPLGGGNNTVTMSGGTLTATGTTTSRTIYNPLVIASNTSSSISLVTFNGPTTFSGTGSLNTVTFAGATEFDGGTVSSTPTINAIGPTTFSGIATIDSGKIVTVAPSGGVTVSFYGPISGAGSMVSAGSGTVSLGQSSSGAYVAETYAGGFTLASGTVTTRARTETTVGISGTTSTYAQDTTTMFGSGVLYASGGQIDIDGLGFFNNVSVTGTLAFTKGGTNGGRSISAVCGTVDLNGSGTINVDDANPDNNIPYSNAASGETQQEVVIQGKVTDGTLIKTGRRRLYLSDVFNLGAGHPNGASSDFAGITISQGEVIPSYITSQGFPGPLGEGLVTLNGGQLGYYAVTTGQNGTAYFVPVLTSSTDRPVYVGTNGGTIDVGDTALQDPTNAYTYSLTMGQLSGVGAFSKTGKDPLAFTSTSNTLSGAINVLAGTLAMGSINSSGGALTLGDSTSTSTPVTFSYTGATASGSQNLVRVSASADFLVDDSQALTLSGTESGAGKLIKGGTGTLAFTGAIGGSGPIAVQTGMLQIIGTFTSTGSLSFSDSAGTIQVVGPHGLTSQLIAIPAGNTLSVVAGASGGTVSLAGFTDGTSGSTGTLNIDPSMTLDVVNSASASTYTFSGSITGAGTLTQSGSAVVRLLRSTTGATKSLGFIEVGAGTLELSGNGALSATSPAAVDIATAATLTVTTDSQSGTVTIGALTGAGTATVFGGALSSPGMTLAFGPAAGTTTFAGLISGAGSFAMVGAGVERLSGTVANTGTLGLTVIAGELRLGDGMNVDLFSSSYAGTSTVTGGKMNIVATYPSSAGSLTFTGTTNAATIQVSGPHTLITRDINVTPANATLFISGVADGSGTIEWSGSTTDDAGGTVGESGATLTYTGTATFGGTVTATGGGSLTADPGAANGIVTIRALSGPGLVFIDPSMTLSLNPDPSTTSVFTGNTAGSGEISHDAAGTHTFTGTLGHSGGIVVTAGRLILAGTYSSTYTGSAIVTGTGTLEIDTAYPLTAGLGFAGGATATSPGAGPTMILNWAPDWTGRSLTVPAGNTLIFDGASTASSHVGVVMDTLTVGETGDLIGTSAAHGMVLVSRVPANSLGGRGSDSTVIVLNNLNIAQTTNSSGTATYVGEVDLTNNDLIIHSNAYTSEATVRAMIAAWGPPVQTTSGSYTFSNTPNFSGLGSSMVGNGDALSACATLGVITNDDGTGTGTPLDTYFDGVPVSHGDLLVKYTYMGDTMLRGYVDADDLANLLAGMDGGLTGWISGDTNYDGVVNSTDLQNLLNSMAICDGGGVNMLVRRAGAGGGGGDGSAVPEPSALVVGLVGVPLLARRRR